MNKLYLKIERFVLVILFLYSITIGFITGHAYISLKQLKGIKSLERYKPVVPSKIFDVKNRLISEYFIEKREVVPLNQIPDIVKEAVIAVEDRDFYKHKGINFKGILRAFFVNLLAGRIKEGGSTITQQLAKVLFTTRKRTILRKLKEAWLALQIEKLYTKDEILEFYLNQMYFGHGAYGIETASRFYFNKSAKDLTIAEAALLAGIIALPNKYSPIRNPELSQRRHWKVLHDLVEEGIITEKQAREEFYKFWLKYKGKILSPYITSWKLRTDKAPYFTEYIRQLLEKKYGASTIYQDGLKIYTTLDLDYQKVARETLQSYLEKYNQIYARRFKKLKNYLNNYYLDTAALLGIITGNPALLKLSEQKDILKINRVFQHKYLDTIELVSLLFGIDSVEKFTEVYREKTKEGLTFDRIEGAIISIDPHTGYIKVMVGGSGFRAENQLNRCVQAYRQVGSAIKPIIYTCALKTGKFTPATTFMDEPIVYVDKTGKEWIPNNFSGKYYGLVTLRKALKHSINIISVKVADQLGIDEVRNFAAKMFHLSPNAMRRRLPRDLSIALGNITVSPLELATAYAIIANGGKDVIPLSIRYVEDRYGNMIINYEKEVWSKPHRRLFTPQVAFLITDMMSEVLKPGGTAWGAVCETGFHLIAYGKTGTTDNWRDAWFAGFNKRLVTVVWVGFDDYRKSMGAGAEGGRVAAPIWMTFMKKAFQNIYVPPINPPEGIKKIKICKYSGKLPSPECKDVGDEYFIAGSEPTEVCDECGKEKRYEINEDKIKEILKQKRKKYKLKFGL